MTFFVELGAGVAAHLLEKQMERGAHGLGAFAKGFWERYRDGSLGIFIFGPQGTGKSTVLGVLSGSKEVNDVPSEYDSSPKNETAKYKGHLFFKAFAGPGQDTLSAIFWPDLYKQMGKYERAICIFCVSYGCHSLFEEDFLTLKGSSLNHNEALIIKDYLEEKRQHEATQFAEFCSQLRGVAGRLGLMLLVTKQDLWWDQRKEVEQHYGRGAFAKGFRELAEAKRMAGFISARQSASLSLQNLLTSDRKLIVPTTSGYDQLLQRANYSAFLRKLDEMTGSLTEK